MCGIGQDRHVGQRVAIQDARRLVLAYAATLVLDEATWLLDPPRRLERSVSAVPAGGAVVAIAHCLQTAP